VTTTAPYGSWPSPVTPTALVAHAVGLAFPVVAGEARYWVESRPADGGRQVLVRRSPGGLTRDVLPAGFSAHTLVHEYGGRCVAVAPAGLGQETVYFSNFADQRIYRVRSGQRPEPITGTGDRDGPADRYADPVVTGEGRWLICVRERHRGGQVVNDLVAVATDGSAACQRLAGDHDFFSSPCVSPDGTRLAWLSWDLPRMPWDGTELWESAVVAGTSLGPPRLVAGGPEESLSQPRYSPDGRLHYISDRTGWWNIYVDEPGGPRPLAPLEAEFARPDWAFGQSSYVFLTGGALVARWSEGGHHTLGVLTPGGVGFAPVPTPFTQFDGLCPAASGVVAVAASATESPAVVEIDLPAGGYRVLARSRQQAVDPAHLSAPRAIEFPTAHGLTAHALWYPPTNADYVAPAGERPPLVVVSHGGPTSAAAATLDYGIQFWTSRGFGVVDVDYGGSSGYGRRYRERLRGGWGVVDVDDCVNAGRWLADQGLVDGARMVIRGASAGGYTTLCALTFRDVFAAGASHYGVADVGGLARDTHKFESRYLDRLIGPWPEAQALYHQRSPVFHAERLRTPLILFQGAEDKVVPPAQAEAMAGALRANGVPYAYLVYEGEQHGFRRAEHIIHAAEAELSFYGQVLGFQPAGEVEPVAIHNAGALSRRAPPGR
jgi:dipeptidyl aminopeptidase/acylaminoacyl peptidase